MFSRAKLEELFQLSEEERYILEFIEQWLDSDDTETAKAKILEVIGEQKQTTIILCAMLNPRILPFCRNAALDKRWHEYIGLDEWDYIVGGEKYHMQPRSDLPAFDQAAAQYFYALSKDPEKIEAQRKPWRLLATYYGSWHATLNQIVIFEKRLSNAKTFEDKIKLINAMETLSIKMALMHFTPGFLMLAYTYTVIGNVYHDLATKRPEFAALKLSYYNCAYQAYVFAEKLMDLEISKFAFSNASFGNLENLIREFKKDSIDTAKQELAEIIPNFTSRSLYSEAANKCSLFVAHKTSNKTHERELRSLIPQIRG